MNRVVITKSILGICHMQVCAVKGASEDEILEVCNNDNPSGTSNGWSSVVWETNDYKQRGPVQCVDHLNREHLLVVC